MSSTDGFSLTAQPGNPDPAKQVFPTQLQFRFNGVDLGGPDATVLDFVGAFTVTRGSGANIGKITVALA